MLACFVLCRRARPRERKNRERVRGIPEVSSVTRVIGRDSSLLFPFPDGPADRW